MKQQPELTVEEVPTESLIPYARNAKIHTNEQIDQICESIGEFGFNDPVAVWDGPKGTEIVAGHGRVMAAKKLGMAKVPIIRLDHMTDEERKAYGLAHNKLTMNTGWDFSKLDAELRELSDFDMASLGFDMGDTGWDGTALSTEGRETNAEYDAFTDKFEPKLTTDDCYTPGEVYQAVKDWACSEYGIDPDSCVRPFYPGGDYERFDYPDSCTVLDNPPFSILAKIIDFYEERGIPYFLFGPQLTLFSSNRPCNYVCCGAVIEYENGAKVNTGFVTSYGEWKIDTAPGLAEAVERAQIKAKQEAEGTPMNIWQLPENVITSAMMGKLGKRGIPFRVPRGSCKFVRKLDNQKRGAALYGGGFIVSNGCAAEKAAAERVDLSPRELEIAASLE